MSNAAKSPSITRHALYAITRPVGRDGFTTYRVGAPTDWDTAQARFVRYYPESRLDNQTGYFIGRDPVRFFEVRSVDANGDGLGRPDHASAKRVPLSALKRSPFNAAKRTPGGIPRPATGTLASWQDARVAAREANRARGRGYRALRAQRNGYAVIFRPAVAGNKQRRVRTLGTVNVLV